MNERMNEQPLYNVCIRLSPFTDSRDNDVVQKLNEVTSRGFVRVPNALILSVLVKRFVLFWMRL